VTRSLPHGSELDWNSGLRLVRRRLLPPEAGSVVPYRDNREKYYHSDAPDLLVQLAVVHAQFEIIHPFLDGNGRLGRILISLSLLERQMLSRPAFYLSEYIEEHKGDYVARLRDLRQALTR
jgi:Fic family protein